MTRDQAIDMLPLIKAFAEGKTILHAYDGVNFVRRNNPEFNDSSKHYKIMEEPREMWVEFRGDGLFFTSETQRPNTVLFREVLPEE